jgi:hypothetical protein
LIYFLSCFTFNYMQIYFYKVNIWHIWFCIILPPMLMLFLLFYSNDEKFWRSNVWEILYNVLYGCPYIRQFQKQLIPILPTNMDMKTKINMCFFMSMIFILIKIKIDIDINNDELFETTWECKRKKKLIITSNVE